LDEYNHKSYECKLQRLERFVAENNACTNNSNGQRKIIIGGVIDIKTANNAKGKIMSVCKLLTINSNNNNEEKKNTIDTTATTRIPSILFLMVVMMMIVSSIMQ
jgi:hypothetical protein